MILLIGINYIFYHLLKAPTRVGRSLLDTIEGFKLFLTVTEKDRLNMLNPPEKTPDLFEKYLPYALAFDIEQQWAEQFSDILSATAVGEGGTAYSPSWYSGSAFTSLTAGGLVTSLSSSFSSAISSSSTAPGSSSGGGGGGSSGGGGAVVAAADGSLLRCPAGFFIGDLYRFPVELEAPANGCGFLRPLK